MNKKLIGFLLISIGVGIILTIIIPDELWSFVVAVLTIILGFLLVRC